MSEISRSMKVDVKICQICFSNTAILDDVSIGHCSPTVATRPLYMYLYLLTQNIVPAELS